jgi:hypothetical protein
MHVVHLGWRPSHLDFASHSASVEITACWENPPFCADSLHMSICDVYFGGPLSASIPFRHACCRSGLHPAAGSQDAQCWAAGHIIHEDGAVQPSPRNRGRSGTKIPLSEMTFRAVGEGLSGSRINSGLVNGMASKPRYDLTLRGGSCIAKTFIPHPRPALTRDGEADG